MGERRSLPFFTRRQLCVAVARRDEGDRGTGEDGDRGTTTVTWVTTPDSPPSDSTPSSLKDSAADSPICHGSTVDDAFATQPALEAFSPPSIYAESKGQGFDRGFGGSDDPILLAPSEMLPEEGFALREWRGATFKGKGYIQTKKEKGSDTSILFPATDCTIQKRRTDQTDSWREETLKKSPVNPPEKLPESHPDMADPLLDVACSSL
ncbi:hypothetical protein DVH24_010529 [Malus domestica]|uniref:Uncharacterized protein n=1 Tax=Malus domestica TaxID=3750 RepID=A0A498JWP8_MALDO|nr:hypothetical protein DVH24_010529 [Malus domestica]